MTSTLRTVLPEVLLKAVMVGRASLDYASKIVHEEPTADTFRPFLDYMGGADLDSCAALLEGEGVEMFATTFLRLIDAPFVSLSVRVDGKRPWIADWEVIRE